MKKQMINGFLIPLAHPTPIDQHHIFLPQIVQRENLAQGSRPNEESHPQRGFSTPNALPRKGEVNIRNKNIIERSHLKLPLPIRNPPNFVNPATQIIRVKEIIERSQIFHFPIIQRTKKVNIPLTRSTQRIKIISNRSLLVAC
jgi:hypothetical protein